jgi:transcriptional regulator with XRE-family HTH domain
MTTQERIKAYCKLKKISIRQFEIQSKLSNGYVSSMRKGLGIEKLENVLNAFPDLSREWLLYGEGDMLKGEVQTFELKTDQDRAQRRVPVFDLAATAGFIALYNDLSPGAREYITIPNLPPVDGAIYARGDSMSPLIESGDIIIFKKVDLCPDNVLWGHIYIVSYSIEGDDYTVLKYLRQSPRNGYIRLESFNSRYDPQDIPASSITALALVKASITFHTIG